MENKFFEDSTGQLRSYEIDGQLWFVFEDVLDVLELQESDTKRLQREVPEVFSTINDSVRVINEKGFYYLMLFVSTSPDAKQFADWVFGKVVPSILTKGYFSVNEEEE